MVAAAVVGGLFARMLCHSIPTLSFLFWSLKAKYFPCVHHPSCNMTIDHGMAWWWPSSLLWCVCIKACAWMEEVVEAVCSTFPVWNTTRLLFNTSQHFFIVLLYCILCTNNFSLREYMSIFYCLYNISHQTIRYNDN